MITLNVNKRVRSSMLYFGSENIIFVFYSSLVKISLLETSIIFALYIFCISWDTNARHAINNLHDLHKTLQMEWDNITAHVIQSYVILKRWRILEVMRQNAGHTRILFWNKLQWIQAREQPFGCVCVCARARVCVFVCACVCVYGPLWIYKEC